MNRARILILLSFLAFASCKQQKDLIYFQGAIPELNNDSLFRLKIFPGDILSITIFTINTEAYPYLSAPNDRYFTDNRSAYEKGYMVNDAGEVNLPLVNRVLLKGLTIPEATSLLEGKFREYIDDPIVTVKKLNFKVTVLGEVNRPGTYAIQNEQVTLPEVLGMAGDLSQYADRRKLRIIREEGGQRSDFFVDLTEAESLSASRYFLHPNDIVYVQPLPRRAFQNISPSVTLFTSLLTTTIIVLTFIITQK
jgi:polysaccharide export outer membrane protein